MPKGKGRKRHLKREWRKVDTTSVQDASIKRTEDELAGGPLERRADSSLFVVDKTKATENLPPELRKKRARETVLNLDQRIASYSKNVLPTGKRQATSGPSKYEQEKLKAAHRKLHRDAKKAASSSPAFNTFDIWDAPTDLIGDSGKSTKRKQRVESEFIGEIVTTERPSKKRRIESPGVAKTIPHVQVPEPGLSYNPAPEDHQANLKKAFDVAVARKKEEQKLKREQHVKEQVDPFTIMQGGKFETPAATGEGDEGEGAVTAMEFEMAHGTRQLEDPVPKPRAKKLNARSKRRAAAADQDEDDDTKAGPEGEEEEAMNLEEEVELVAPVKTNQAYIDRKTKAQRNKEKRKREHGIKMRLATRELRAMRGINKLDSLIEQHEKKIDSISQTSQERQARKAQRLGRLGREQLPQEAVEYTLTEELPESLRTKKQSSSLLADRFDSLKRRGLIEHRDKKYWSRRYEKKTYESHPAKDFVKEQESKYADLLK